MAMQEQLRHSQSSKGDDRLAMRAVITLGDMLTEEGDCLAMRSLADRIEAVTPRRFYILRRQARGQPGGGSHNPRR
jgi:hypothetical protein